MPFIQYIEKNIGKRRLALIQTANDIIEEYNKQGFSLTLRQLYYQFVSRDVIPNNQAAYNMLGNTISDGRLCGLIDWDAISDRLRELHDYNKFLNAVDNLQRATDRHAINLWEGQEYQVEVWVEKDALAEVILKACRPYRVPAMICRGYMSQSAMWEAGHTRFQYARERGRMPVVIHLGDHDPSGLDMTRDISERLAMFAGGEVQIERIALNMNQVRKYNPPPNPAKITDTRADKYIAEFGQSSWELDALEPQVLVKLIQAEIVKYIDMPTFEERQREEGKQQDDMQLITDNYDRVLKVLKRKGRK